jgi:GntR family transcriptional regulator, transcriptional repressor for pyruvate dehydrogenase complex
VGVPYDVVRISVKPGWNSLLCWYGHEKRYDQGPLHALVHQAKIPALWVNSQMKLPRYPKNELKKLSHIAKELGAVRPVGLTEQLVQRLESLVLKGVLSPGEQLPSERQLAGLLSVSRASLRQALKVLQVMGVLEVRHGSGNYLSAAAEEILKVPPRVLVPLRGLTQAELFEVRRAMEAEAAAAAAERATEKEIELMRIELNGMRANRHDRVAYGVHDLAFHNAIAAASSNRCFIWFLSLANKVLYQALLRRPNRKSLESSIEEHENILRAIEIRNPDLARKEMLKHVSYAKYYFLDRKDLAEIRFVAYESSDAKPSSAPREFAKAMLT